MKVTIIAREMDKTVVMEGRIVKCPIGKNRRMKANDSPYNSVCDGCIDNTGGHMNSYEEIIYCDYIKRH